MHLGMSYSDVRKLPTVYRSWFIKRLNKHFQDQNDRINNKQNTSTISSKEIDKYKGIIDQKFSS